MKLILTAVENALADAGRKLVATLTLSWYIMGQFLKILIDMNLSPDWVDVFAKHGITQLIGQRLATRALKILT